VAGSSHLAEGTRHDHGISNPIQILDLVVEMTMWFNAPCREPLEALLR
jgi:hypothetical protein